MALPLRELVPEWMWDTTFTVPRSNPSEPPIQMTLGSVAVLDAGRVYVDMVSCDGQLCKLVPLQTLLLILLRKQKDPFLELSVPEDKAEWASAVAAAVEHASVASVITSL